MSFLETRGMLAKLLATENLQIQHSASANTASFDTDTRVLTLPIFKTEDKHVYNMLVAHESSHALNTPADWAERVPAGVPFDYVNVIEDVRIERLIQSRFPGLKVDFTRGYDELNNRDFFAINDTDVNKMSFIDRINLHFKLGARALIKFSDAEMPYVTAVDEADSFDKVLLAAAMIHDYIQSAKQDSADTPEIGGNASGDGEQETSQSSASNSNSSETDDDGEGEGAESGESTPDLTLDTPDEEVSTTQQNFDRKMEYLNSNNYERDVMYVIPSTLPLSQLIVSNSDYRQSCSFHPSYRSDFLPGLYSSFLDSIKRDVNFMVQQFEMRKSADAYARTQEHKTGVLNTNALHNYKLTDDVFLRHNVTADGKNHGMVMLIDWSGSMDTILLSVVKQVIVLVQFCRKVQIPFDVYTFTTGCGPRDENAVRGTVVMDQTQIVNVLSSSAKRSEIDTDLRNLFYGVADHSGDFMCPYHSLGGTPLDCVLTIMPRVINDFKRRTGAQKVNFTCLSDGESSPIRSDDGSGHTTYAYYERVLLRDGVNVIDIGEQHNTSTGRLANWIGQMPDVSVTNIFLGSLKECSNYIRPFRQNVDGPAFKRENAFVVTTDNYWGMIACINPKAFGDAQDEMEVQSGATKAQIRSALKRMLKTKQSSKVLLTQIVSNIS